MGARFGGVIGVGGRVVGFFVLLVFGGRGQVAWCGGFLGFALDGGFLFGFGGGAALFAGQLGLVGVVLGRGVLVGVILFFFLG